jgi:hypothetical protein
MNTIFDSPNYCVVEFPLPDKGSLNTHGGYEIMSKHLRREIFLGGADAELFRASVQQLIAREPTADDVDEFLDGYTGLMNTPLALH